MYDPATPIKMKYYYDDRIYYGVWLLLKNFQTHFAMTIISNKTLTISNLPVYLLYYNSKS